MKSIVQKNEMVIIYKHDNTTFSFPLIRSDIKLNSNNFVSIAMNIIRFQTVEHSNIDIITTTDVELVP